jgi:hypothetical protein
MLKKGLPILALAAVAVLLVAAEPADRSKTYSVTADTIEGCSCPLFCTCYFGPSSNEHMCMFNNVYKFHKGSHYGNVDLSDQLVWMSGDLGGEWHKNRARHAFAWAVVTRQEDFGRAEEGDRGSAERRLGGQVGQVLDAGGHDRVAR